MVIDIWKLIIVIIIIIRFSASFMSIGWDYSGLYLQELRTDTSKPSYRPSTGAWYELNYITLHYIALYYITLHYITLHYITLHYIYSFYI